MKKIVSIVFLFGAFASFSQQPAINSISPKHIEVGQVVTISGSNLGGTVFFGGVEATFTGSGNILEAIVPAGATQGPIIVQNNGLLAQSSEHFFISYSGSTITTYESEVLVQSNDTDANDICICDLDKDGLNDAVIAHSIGDPTKSEITLYQNQSTVGGVANFTRITEFDATNSGTDSNNPDNLSGFISVTCADLDNDGLSELIFTTNQGTNSRHIYIYKNQSGGIADFDLRYQSSVNLKLPDTPGGDNRVPRTIKATDIDGDGKNDLVVGNDTDNTIHIFRNTSGGTISFASANEIDADGDLSGVIGIADLDSDGRVDIISMPFRENSTRIHIFKNNSIVGDINFVTQASITNGGQTNNVSTGDFDDDGLIDIAVASRNTGIITTFRNSTSDNSITFDAGENISISGASPFGIDFGDINGDGLLDIVSTFAAGNVYVVPNTSISGNISFGTEQELTSAEPTQNVCVGDINGDAKPDIVYTHNVEPGQVGDLGIRVNRNCMTPVISPSNLTFCTGDPFTLEATKGIGTYTWSITSGDGTDPVDTDSDAVFTLNSGTAATIQVTFTQLGCSESSTASFTLTGGTPPSAPTISSPDIINPTDVICAGDPFTLNVSGGPYEAVEWTLPDGSTENTSQINVTNATSADAGNYSVRVKPSSTCFSDKSAAFEVQLEEAPSRSIINQGCTGSSITLDVGAGSFNYNWRRDGTLISETGTTIQTAQAGVYTVDVETIANNCVTESQSFTVPQFTVSSFSIPTSICTDSPIQLSSTSTSDASFTIVEQWEVLDNSSNPIASTDTTLTTAGDLLDFSFSRAGDYKIRLTTSYSDFDACPSVLVRDISVLDPPTITFDTAEDTEKCQGEGLTVGITSPAGGEIAAYEWSINGVISSNPTVEATTLVGLDSVYAVVTITTTIGCQVKDSVKIKNFPTDADIISSLYDLSNDTVTLEDDNFIEITASNIISDLAWSPSSVINDTTQTNITVFPANSPTTVVLSGVDENGCQVATSLTIILDNIRPRRTFSPNGDGQGFDCWEILNTSELTGCKVYVFDSKGKNILVADSPFPNNCVWDGNYNGSQMSEGVYYFVLKCDDSNLTKSGSMLLAR